ncbi:SAM-dependent methyltransferase [Streptomyces montanisoli]|uniref:SAM-dependent methyltransferase n=1 Tax=Streptomyces montanisoli TaxID=2798581 RepID=A0A940MA86_9ACTN|nr:SAM-dependent methyltransferase [Streptomyces montanisoli]MBP0457232.1 SAM-dependent methyltransferase [Streptomyces montanisoli]
MTSGTHAPRIDTSRPHPARIYDYLLGGKDNYPVDQAVAERLPVEARNGAAANRAFMRRGVEWTARTGIDQFLDVGTGIPTEPNLHQIVQGVNPTCRIVYVDNDPIVLRHAEALLVSRPEGRTAYVQSDVLDPEAVLEQARETLDFERPVALSLIALLHFVPDDRDPYAIVRTLLEPLAPGSCLILSHLSMDRLTPEQDRTEEYRNAGIDLRPRTHAEVLRFFDGLDLVEPGLVPCWHKDSPRPEDADLPGADSAYAGVGFVR